MKLEYRILELAKGDEQECHYCFVDYDNPTNLNFDTAPATHQMIAHTETEQYFDISFICKDCKAEYDGGVLPRCEKCDRLKRNKSRCYCHKVKKKATLPTERELISQSFSSRLENKTRELEKELSTTKEELNIEREEIAKFQEKSEEWGKRQKQELLDRIKELETEVERLKKQTPQALVNEIESLKSQLKQQNAQIEVKEPKKWPWKLRK